MKVNLTWDSIGDIDSYTIYRVNDPFPEYPLPLPTAEGITTKSYIDELPLDLASKYYYRIESVKGDERKISELLEVISPIVATVTLSDFPVLTLGDNFRPDFTSDPDFTANTVVWTSSNTEVATTDGQGTLTIVGPGTTTIGLIVNGRFTDQKDLVIVEPIVSSIKVKTLAGKLGFSGAYGDELVLSNGTTYRVTSSGSVEKIVVPEGTHTLNLTEDRDPNIGVQIGGPVLLSIDKFPNMPDLNMFGFATLTGFSTDKLESVPSYLPSNITNISYLFSECRNFTGAGVENWDVRHVISMKNLFYKCYKFNGDLSKWNTESLVNMRGIFENCYLFNKPLLNFKVDKVVDMDRAFSNARVFNQYLGNWCVTNIMEKPLGFSDNSALTIENLPVWGTCPVE